MSHGTSGDDPDEAMEPTRALLPPVPSGVKPVPVRDAGSGARPTSSSDDARPAVLPPPSMPPGAPAPGGTKRGLAYPVPPPPPSPRQSNAPSRPSPARGSTGPDGPAKPRKERDTDEELIGRDPDLDDVSQSGQGGRVSFSSLSKVAAVGIFGQYQLLGRLAYGGMAEIFLGREGAEAGRGGRFLVIKRVLPHVAADSQFIAMFKDEARLAMQLNHPNICHVYAFGQQANAYYIAMEWVNGMPVSKLIRRAREQGGLAVPLALKIISHVAEALDHAHRATDQTTGEPLGIVHRDVSPQNVMVSYDGVVKLLDFGIAKAASHSTRTEAGVVKGKFAYMSPQQCLGEPIDARADVFALGVCMYELLDGTNPFKRSTEFDTMRALVYEDAPSLFELHPHISHEVDAIVQRAIAKRPEERFQTAADMQLAIEQVLARMGEIVPNARIAETMGQLFVNEIKAGPRLDTRIQVPPKEPGQSASGDSSAKVLPAANATERMQRVTHEPSRPSDLSTATQDGSTLGLVLLFLLATTLVVAALGVAGWWTGFLHFGDRPPVVEVTPPPVVTPPTPEPTPPSVVPEQAATATLLVDSAPSGATIELVGRGVIGRTPMEVALLPAQDWTVRLTLDGYQPWTDTVPLHPGDRAPVFGELEPVRRRVERPVETPQPVVEERPPAAQGRLSVNSRPWSKVYVGSRLLGTTPIGDVEVGAGTVRLRLVDRDGLEHTRTIQVPADGSAREFFDLTSDPAPEAP